MLVRPVPRLVDLTRATRESVMDAEPCSPMIPYNPHIKYYEGDRRGYFKATVTPKRMCLDLRFVTSVENPTGTGYTEGSWVVEDGQAGANPA